MADPVSPQIKALQSVAEHRQGRQWTYVSATGTMILPPEPSDYLVSTLTARQSLPTQLVRALGRRANETAWTVLNGTLTNGTLVNGTAANTTATAPVPETTTRPVYFRYIGIALAIVAGLLTGTGLPVQKYGERKARAKRGGIAGEGLHFMREKWWWFGIAGNLAGELCNFGAYFFTDAIIIAPIQALQVVVAIVVSRFLLKERLNEYGMWACFLILVGCVIISLNVPSTHATSQIPSMDALQKYCLAPGFLVYLCLFLLLFLFIVFYAGRRWGKKHILVYLSICAWTAGTLVVLLGGLAGAGSSHFHDSAQHWLFWVAAAFVVLCLLSNFFYINKTLALFDANLMLPIYFVYFTLTTFVTTAIFYQGVEGTPITIITFTLGFAATCAGVRIRIISRPTGSKEEQKPMLKKKKKKKQRGKKRSRDLEHNSDPESDGECAFQSTIVHQRSFDRDQAEKTPPLPSASRRSSQRGVPDHENHNDPLTSPNLKYPPAFRPDSPLSRSSTVCASADDDDDENAVELVSLASSSSSSSSSTLTRSPRAKTQLEQALDAISKKKQGHKGLASAHGHRDADDAAGAAKEEMEREKETLGSEHDLDETDFGDATTTPLLAAHTPLTPPVRSRREREAEKQPSKTSTPKLLG